MSEKQLPSKQHGMMLLEVLIAILIFSIGVLGMVKMQAVSTANSTNSEDRATAALLAEDVIAAMWIAKSPTIPAADLTAWQGRVQAAFPVTSPTLSTGGKGTVTVTGGTTATVKIQWNRRLGRNADFASAATDPNAIATYQTQVIIQ